MSTFDGATCHDEMVQKECQDRREAELEFISSAYTPAEAFCNANDSLIVIHRRLHLTYLNADPTSTSLPIVLILELPMKYPIIEPLLVKDVKLEPDANGNRNAVMQKKALNALPSLLETCRNIAEDLMGEESVFVVFSAAEDWINEEWPKLVNNHNKQQDPQLEPPDESLLEFARETKVLGRRLIYSHHIIAKKKRADIKALVANYELTGYMKIGWPGLLIVEGDEEDCNQFYDVIRPWSWQYLVVRGEQNELVPNGKSIESMRRFTNFIEVDDMSVVADHCREVGLEALFRTSMKQYQRSTEELAQPHGLTTTTWYGALALVDHMNDGKGYRKWLRKCSRDVGCLLFVKQFYPGGDYTNRPMIYVGLIGDRTSVSTFLKRWRTSRVDVDTKGKPCLERQMEVLTEGELDGACAPNDTIDWDMAASEEKITINHEDLVNVLRKFGWSLDGH
jgi:hypothetical protein